VRITTEQDAANPNPTFIPAANRAAQWLAARIGGTPQSGITEALFNVPTTAHILGGAVMAGDPSQGVIDARGQVFGYQNLLITDGSALPANPGVNPSLTITALAEHTIAQVPATGAAERAARNGPALG
jgi:cholesterol oxidase